MEETRSHQLRLVVYSMFFSTGFFRYISGDEGFVPQKSDEHEMIIIMIRNRCNSNDNKNNSN